MKKILLIILLSFFSSLFAEDVFGEFIDAQMKVEAQLLDANLSLDKKAELRELQEIEYKDFFFRYASEKEKHLQELNPDRVQISHLELRLKGNRYRGYTNAALRDEILLKIFSLRTGMRNAVHEVLALSSGDSKNFFNEKVNDIIVKYFENYTPLDKSKYLPKKDQKTTKITQEIEQALKDLSYIENVSHTLSSQTIENISLIYSTAHFSDSKIFTLINQMNNTEYGKNINKHLQKFHLDIAKIILLLLLILFIIVIHLIVNFSIKLILAHYKAKGDDREYIHSRIAKVFNYIAYLMVIHLLIVSYIGFETTSVYISKGFYILYVLLVTVLLYRITNTIAYMKMESMKKSKILKNEVVNLSLKVINGFIILFSVIVILKIFGVNLTALLSGLGIAGAAVAFAAKDSISNIFASLSILLGDVFEQGDWIETKDVNGTVVEIGLRASTIRTFDNALISIPNSELANHSVKNWSRRSIGRRIKMQIGVTYQSKFSDIKQAITEIKEMLKEHPGIANEHTAYQNAYRQARLVSAEDFKGVKRTTLVYMDSYGASSINILIYCFSRTVDWAEWLEVKEDVMYKIAEILEANNLEFAYPTMTIHQAETDNDLENKTRPGI